jgi:hypothetical protein
LDELCIRLGFCLSAEDQRRLVDETPPEVLGFTDAVLTAEGLAPDTVDRRLYRQVRDMIADAFRRAELEGEEGP